MEWQKGGLATDHQTQCVDFRAFIGVAHSEIDGGRASNNRGQHPSSSSESLAVANSRWMETRAYKLRPTRQGTDHLQGFTKEPQAPKYVRKVAAKATMLADATIQLGIFYLGTKRDFGEIKTGSVARFPICLDEVQANPQPT